MATTDPAATNTSSSTTDTDPTIPPMPPAKQHQQQPAAPMKPLPTRKEINRAVQAERAAADAYAASIFTERQLNIFRALACLPEKLPDSPIETWNINIDPNAPISVWRLALVHYTRHRADRYAADDGPAPTAGTRGNHSGNSGNPSGNPTGNRAAPHPSSPSPHGPFPWREGGRGLGSGNPGNHSGNTPRLTAPSLQGKGAGG